MNKIQRERFEADRICQEHFGMSFDEALQHGILDDLEGLKSGLVNGAKNAKVAVSKAANKLAYRVKRAINKKRASEQDARLAMYGASADPTEKSIMKNYGKSVDANEKLQKRYGRSNDSLEYVQTKKQAAAAKKYGGSADSLENTPSAAAKGRSAINAAIRNTKKDAAHNKLAKNNFGVMMKDFAEDRLADTKARREKSVNLIKQNLKKNDGTSPKLNNKAAGPYSNTPAYKAAENEYAEAGARLNKAIAARNELLKKSQVEQSDTVKRDLNNKLIAAQKEIQDASNAKKRAKDKMQSLKNPY